MPTTPRHGFLTWSAGFTQSDTILNDLLDKLDVRVALAVLSRTTDAQPGSPSEGDCYIMTGSASGAAWAAYDEHDVAVFRSGVWTAVVPIMGLVAWVDDDGEGVTFDGAAWTVTSSDLSTYATQAYVNAALVGLVDLKGDYNASTNTPDLDTSPSGILKGDAWECSVAGTFFTFDLDVGDIVVAKQDDPTTEAHWIINKEAGGSGGLDEAAVDARVVAVASGKKDKWISIQEMYAGSTQNPGAEALLGGASGATSQRVRPFDDSAVEFMLYDWVTPGGFDPAVGLSFTPIWSPAGSSTGVVRWEMRGLFLADGAASAAHESAGNVYSDDAGAGTAGLLQKGPESNAHIFSGTASKSRFLALRFQRLATSGTDTFSGDANLVGIILHYHTDAPTDD